MLSPALRTRSGSRAVGARETVLSLSLVVGLRLLIPALGVDSDGAALFTVPLRRQEVPIKSNGKTVAYKSAYFGSIFVGSPEPQEFSVVFDTGSGHVLLPSSFCRDELSCLKHRRYNRELSATARPALADADGSSDDNDRGSAFLGSGGGLDGRGDRVSIAYGTGEVSGDIVSDVVCIGRRLPPVDDNFRVSAFDEEEAVGPSGRPNRSSLTRAAASSSQHCARTRIVIASEMTPEPFGSFEFDGVLGLGLDSLALEPDFHLLGQLIKGQGLPPVFGVHLGSPVLSSLAASAPAGPFSVAAAGGATDREEEGPVGEISFGGPDERRCVGGCSAAMRWAPVADPSLGYWRVAIHALRVGQRPLSMCASVEDGCFAIIDTGTSMLGVPREAFATLLGLTARAASSDEVDCRSVPGPALAFELGGGVEVALAAEDYSRPAVSKVSRRDGDAAKVCRASLLPVDLPPSLGKVFLLGENVLRKYYTAFDAGQKLVGFAPSAAPSGRQGAGAGSGKAEEVFAV